MRYGFDRFRYPIVGSPKGQWEDGENPSRTRRCDRGRTPQGATIGLIAGWEGAVSRMIRKSEDLPMMA